MRTLRARWVVPVDRPPIENGGVAFSEGRIAAVGKASELPGKPEDLGDAALLPGLINAHTHLEFSDCRSPLPPAGGRLPAWIRGVIAQRNRRNRDPAAAIQQGLAESFACGVTTVVEIATQPAACYVAATPRPRVTLLQEAIGFSAARAESVFADVLARVEECESVAAADLSTGNYSSSSVQTGVSPHAPYTVHPELLEKLVWLASQRRQLVAMHLAESPEELQLLAANEGPFREILETRSMWDGSAIPHGTKPLDYLQRLVKTERSLAIHGNYFSCEEIAFCGAHRDRLSVVYCPRTHAYFGHPAYPLEAMWEAGVRVVAGTDSRASNPDLSLLAELRAIAQRWPQVAHEQILRMGTLDAAEAIGEASTIGSLTLGKRADVITIACTAQENPLSELLESDEQVGAVWLAGTRTDALPASD